MKLAFLLVFVVASFAALLAEVSDAKRTAIVLAIVAAVALLACLVDIAWCMTGKRHEVHDVTIRVYYLDGSTQVLQADSVLADQMPYIDGYYGDIFLQIKGEYIRAIDRFELLTDTCYEVTGRELYWKKKTRQSHYRQRNALEP